MSAESASRNEMKEERRGVGFRVRLRRCNEKKKKKKTRTTTKTKGRLTRTAVI